MIGPLLRNKGNRGSIVAHCRGMYESSILNHLVEISLTHSWTSFQSVGNSIKCFVGRSSSYDYFLKRNIE
jgi:hypothetical protein